MIVFIDQPLNVGWSYSNEPGLKIYNSTVAGQHLANFAYNFY
jgi:carboxypeptidase C (cathepsin A)